MKKLNLLQVKNQLSLLNLTTFKVQDLSVIFQVSQRAAQAFLVYNTKKGAFIRLKAGLYAQKDHLPSEFTLANLLYYPSYISLDSALSYYQLIPETIYSIISVTSKSTREFKINHLTYNYHRIKKSAFTGFVPTTIFNQIAYIAVKEKAVADFLYFIYLKKRSYNDRLKINNLDLKKLKNYLKLFSQPQLISFSNNLLKQKL
ncbi:MAG: hypothetical protein ABIJ43_02755 [Candidatus Beckwithbacteria bacterium]|nr:hypothetical protein [Patescibacteria group bacterium]